MNLRTRAAIVFSALALLTGGLAAAAGPASAVGGCPSGKLCLYSGANYSGLYWTSASTATCVPGVGSNGGPPASYVNNLPVQVKMWGYTPGGGTTLSHRATIRAGGFTSNTGGTVYWNEACTGGVNPN